MSYLSKSIKETIQDINANKIYLPAIQRKFVWPRQNIERLFDSIMRNYPIGSFLFWELSTKKANEYVFYEFLRNYDEQKPYNTRKEGAFLGTEIIGVLDGQQRLSSMFLGLSGHYKAKLKHRRKGDPNAYPKRWLYLNLLNLPYKEEISKEDKKHTVIDREKDFEFSFLTSSESKKKDKSHYWMKVGEVLKWGEDPEIDEIYEEFIDGEEIEETIGALTKQKKFVKKALRDLHKRIHQDKLINYFKVTKDDLDDILQIFVRVNSGGTKLSKTDLLFSTIVATWEDGRDEIEDFQENLNKKGEGFRFDNDFLMRSCLVLSDLPVLFKVNSFKSENVQLIKSNWKQIKAALDKTIEVICEFGFSSATLTSNNAIIPIAYHFMKGGNGSKESKAGIQKYLLHALLNNIYSGQGDQVIATFRTQLSIKSETGKISLKTTEFIFKDILRTKLPASKTLHITKENIEAFMEYTKGAKSFFVLSFLYPQLHFHKVHFHQDHIHPSAGFKNNKLKPFGLDDETISNWLGIKDTIPNLQLMEGKENESKNATPFKKWLTGETVGDVEKFKLDNFIPKEVDLGIEHFESFYTARKQLIIDKLVQVLNLEKAETEA